MGQAFRRAAGRIRSSSVDTTPPPPATSHLKKSVDRTSPAVPADNLTGINLPAASENGPKDADNVIEDRDSQYDVMLNQMVGRIRSQPGGKLEIGEATVVDKYNRPLPKLRNTTTESSSKYEARPVPLGTLNVAQLRQIILLHQGKSDEHNGPMDTHQIAVKFRVDVGEVEKILHYISLPPESIISNQKNDQ